jgi:UDP-glucose 4-epimerase
VVAIFTQQMLDGRPVTINGSGEQQRDFVYVEDCVRANLLAMERGDGQVLNLGSGVGTSVNQIFISLRGITGYQREAVHGSPKLGETFINIPGHRQGAEGARLGAGGGAG